MQNGKGDNWRKGTNFKKYWDSPYWNKPQKSFKKKSKGKDRCKNSLTPITKNVNISP